MLSRIARFGAALILLGYITTSADEPKAPPTQPPGTPQVEDFAPAEEFVNIDGLKTHFVRKGEQGPVIVLLHGFGSSTYTWRLNVEELAKKHQVYALDLKGFGLTAKPKDGNYHVGAYADQLRRFLDVMKLPKVILAGNSMGGAVAMNLALRYPERVEGLILIDAAPPNFAPMGGVENNKAERTKEETKPQATQSVLRSVLTRALVNKSMVEAGLKGAYHKPEAFVTPEMVEIYYRPLTIDGALEALASMGKPPKTEPLPPLDTLKKPVLIIWGRHDKVIPVSVADYFAKTISGSKKVILEDSGHLPHEEEALTFNRLVSEFVAGLPSKTVIDAPAPAKPQE